MPLLVEDSSVYFEVRQLHQLDKRNEIQYSLTTDRFAVPISFTPNVGRASL